MDGNAIGAHKEVAKSKERLLRTHSLDGFGYCDAKVFSAQATLAGATERSGIQGRAPGPYAAIIFVSFIGFVVVLL